MSQHETDAEAETSAGPATRSSRAARPARIQSLDISRGFLVTISVTSAAVLAPRPDWLEHSAWEGITFFDVIFPVFVALSGCGMAFAYRNRVSWLVTLRRAVILFLIGAAYNAAIAFPDSFSQVRLTGPLQIYAGLLILAHLLHLILGTDWRRWAGFTLGFGVVWTGFLWWAGRGCDGGVVTRECNPTMPLESWIYGMSHLYRQGERGFEPEGLIGTTGALVTCAAGITAGHILLRWRGRRGAVPVLAAWALVCAGAGVALQPVVPFLKWMWSPSYGLLAGSAALVLLALTAAIWDVHDGRGRSPGSPRSGTSATPATGGRLRDRLITPWTALGRNALLVYFGSHVVYSLAYRVGEPSLPERIGGDGGPFGAGGIAYVAGSWLVWTAVAMVLHRNRIYLKPK